MDGSIKGEGQVLEVLQKLEAAGANTRPAMQGVASAVHTRIMFGFRQSTSPYGAAWKPVKGRSGQPLRDNGILQRSVNPTATADEARISVGGAAAKYAAVHQLGATITAKNHPYLRFQIGGRWVQVKQVEIPARPYLPLNDAGDTELPPAWADDVKNRVLRHYQKALG